MKKLILISVMCVIINKALIGQCMEDSTRQSSYSYMEVFRYDTETWEQYNKRPTTSMTVTVIGYQKAIYFRDATNNYNIDFQIKDCWMGDTTMTYKCYDLKNKKDCDLIFGSSPEAYNLTVNYPSLTSRYRLKRAK